jgi:hypothetical protein
VDGGQASAFPPPAQNHLKAMKTVEKNQTGLPSLETEWPKKIQKESEPAAVGANWASERLHQMLQSSISENTWRGFQGYDSPLAG